MARFHVSAFAAVLFFLTLGLGASRSASQKEGFQSINCGGGAFIDPSTTLSWEEDPFNNNSNDSLYGKASKVYSSFENITIAMTTLRYFPSDRKNRKFCYSLPVSNGNTYLLRASFLYGNYDGRSQPPTFLLIFNYDIWATVTTSLSSTPIMQELTFNANEDNLNICVSPLPHQDYTPFISTIELRPLNITMYSQISDAVHVSAIRSGYGLMLWKRINYGSRTKAAIRYPDDEYDRIWEADTTRPTLSTNTSNVGISYILDATQPPAAVLATAIESRSTKENLTFTYEGYGGVNGFRMDLHFEELDERVISQHSGARQLGLAFPNSSLLITNSSMQKFPIIPAPSAPISIFFDELVELPPNLQLTLYPFPASPLGPLLNAIELFFWTPQPLSINGTSPGDVVAITLIQEYFEITGYGQGDPCTPKGYEWAWIICNTDLPPKITQINLASLNLTGDIPRSINDLASLERVDLSHNMLSGPIPDLNNLHALRYLDVSYNNLCGSWPSLPTSVTYKYMGNNGLCDGSACQCNSSPYSNNLTPSTNNNNPKKNISPVSFMGALYVILTLVL